MQLEISKYDFHASVLKSVFHFYQIFISPSKLMIDDPRKAEMLKKKVKLLIIFIHFINMMYQFALKFTLSPKNRIKI